MTTKWIVAFLGVLAVVLIGWTVISMTKAPSTAPATTQTTPPVTTTQTSSTTTQTTTGGSTAKTYTLTDVATHNSETSCWTAINGKVYDVTSWIAQHPGGPDHIIQLCGTDGSAAFNGQHSGQAQPANELATFYIGDLTQ